MLTHIYSSLYDYKEKWAAPYVGTIMNLGVRSTSRTEGTHWVIKDTMETTGSLFRTFKAIHKAMMKSVSYINLRPLYT